MGDIVKLTNSSTGGPVLVYVQDGRIIRVTPMEFDDSDAAMVVAEFKKRLGARMQVDLEFVESIPRSKSGKFRYVISRVPLKL